MVFSKSGYTQDALEYAKENRIYAIEFKVCKKQR